MVEAGMRKRRRWWIWILLLVVIAGGAYGAYRWQNTQTAPATQTAALQTSVARRGEIVLSATGVGTLVAASERSLSFPVKGELLSLDVQVGNRVQAGQTLATIDDTEARLALAEAELQLLQAQRDLEDAQSAHEELLAGPTALDLANARLAVLNAQERLAELTTGPTQAALSSAQASLASAQERLAELEAQPTALTIEQAKMSLERSKNSLWSTQMSRDSTCGMDKNSSACKQAEVSVLNAEISARTAELEYEAALEPATEVALAEARAQVLQAQQSLTDLYTGATEADQLAAETTLAEAEDAMAELEAAPSAEDVAASELRLRQAEMALAQAERQLAEAQLAIENCTMVAPFEGVITGVSGSVGLEVSAGSAVVTVADTSRYVLEIMVDESDMSSLTIGREVEVVFDALPDQVFAGTVTQVNPSLTSSAGLYLASGKAELDATGISKPQGLLLGLGATIDIIGGRAENAVLVPVEALREIETGSYAVFVVVNGEPQLRMVEVGLMDLTYAEIISGVEEGETISTGMVATR
jgi:RND family efflux transporter MFP subunit